MKTNNYIYRTVAAAAMALPLSLCSLSSCSEEDQSLPTHTKGQVMFTASVSEAPVSRADVDYAPAAGNLTVFGNEWASDLKANYGYNSNTEGWTCTSKEPLFWKDIVGTNEYVFYAVAPSEPAAAPEVLKDQSSLENFTASDLLVARSTVPAKNTAVPFVLKHVLSQLEVNVTTTDGDEKLSPEELATTVVTIDGLKSAYTLEAGTTAEAPVRAVAAGEAVNGMKPCKDEGKNTFRYITVPQTVTADPGMTLHFTVNVNGQELRYVYNHKPTFVAGKKNVYNITISKSNLKVSQITVTDWATGNSVEATMKLAGLNEGSMNFAANEGDNLAVYYNEVSTDAVQGSFKYEDNAWTVNTPLYWDDIAQTGYTQKFIAVLTPATKTTPYADFLVGIATDVAFGSGVSFTLQHAAAQFSFVINAGTGITDLNTEVPTRTFTLGEGGAANLNTDGTINYGTLTDKVYDIGTAPFFVTPQTLTESHVVTLTRANGNKYTVKLTDLMNGTDKLFTDGKVEAGKHYTITLTVNETSVGITAGIAAWTEVSGSGTAKPEI